MDQARRSLRAARIEGLFPCVEHEARAGDADHAAGKDVDDEGDVNQALPGRDVRVIRDPQRIGAVGVELPLAPVGGAWPGRISRSTVQRAPGKPSRRSCRQTLRVP